MTDHQFGQIYGLLLGLVALWVIVGLIFCILCSTYTVDFSRYNKRLDKHLESIVDELKKIKILLGGGRK